MLINNCSHMSTREQCTPNEGCTLINIQKNDDNNNNNNKIK
uniref:Uncharacterized protein n=1 Tax=Anguilla anguilla TaxID=7936 RepID=A0A0E9WJJ4_ANGAN